MLLFALLAVASTAVGRAEACVYSVSEAWIGPKPTADEIAAEAKLRRWQMVRAATREAQRELAGGADAAAGLADMLVPNIQAVYIDATGCGVSEIDWAGGDEAGYRPLAGTPYAGRESEFHPIVSDYGPGSLGPPCNAEFRGRFAEHLRRALAPRPLRQSYVFLAARRPRGAVQRLMAFQGKARRPPVQWVADARILDWARRQPSGRALSAAVAGFWRETGPLLAGPDPACPTALAQWRHDQAELVARIEASLEPRPPQPGVSSR